MTFSLHHQVEHFFTQGSAGYDAEILQIVPLYPQLFEELLESCEFPAGSLNKKDPLIILELGCGTGNLSLLLSQVYPNAHLTVVDASAEMVALAEAKISQPQKVSPVVSDFRSLAIPPNSVDLVISSLALHHLPDEDKPGFYQQILGWLKPGGLFRCADQAILNPRAEGLDYQLQRWEAKALANGADPAVLAHWKTHLLTQDHYATVPEYLNWLSEAGFTDVDCYWRSAFWSVFGGSKP